MKIKFIFAVETIENNQKTTYRVGETHDLDDEVAKKLIKEGKAEPAKVKAPGAPPPGPGGN